MTSIEFPDVRLNYQVLGSGTVTTLVHGLGANIAFWYFGAAPMLAHRSQVLMYDLRGHGHSSLPPSGYTLERMVYDLKRLLDTCGVERTNLVGHSYGARLALAFAAAMPERVATLIVADTQIRAIQPTVRLCDWPHWPQWKQDLIRSGRTELPPDDALIDFRLLAELGQSVEPLRAPIASANLNGERSDALPGRVEGGRARRRLNLSSRIMGTKGHKKWCRLLGETTARDELHDETPLVEHTLRRIEAPTMLIYGSLSHCRPTSDALLDLIPNSRRILVPRAGHFFPIVKPKVFAAATLEFHNAAGRRRGGGLKRRAVHLLRAVRRGDGGALGRRDAS